jgi:molybdopterin-guanine dinucleotide biosynthesis protein A
MDTVTGPPASGAGQPCRQISLAAIILAGGAAARLHGADKPALEVGGVPMLVSVARAAAAAGASRVIVVGPERGGRVASGLAEVAASIGGGMVTVRETPPGGGPVPALRRGLAENRAPWVALLAADLPFLTGSWIAGLWSSAASAGRDGAVFTDAGGRPQWLAGCWRAAALTAALAGYRGQSLGGLLDTLRPVLLPADEARPPWLDCDDPQALAAARATAEPDGER